MSNTITLNTALKSFSYSDFSASWDVIFWEEDIEAYEYEYELEERDVFYHTPAEELHALKHGYMLEKGESFTDGFDYLIWDAVAAL